MPLDYHQLQRANVLKRMLPLATFVVIVFALINLYKGNHLLLSIETVIAILGVFSIWRFNEVVTNKTLDIFTVTFTNIIVALLMIGLMKPDTTITLFLWVLITPFWCYILNGVRLGFIFTAIAVSISAVIFVNTLQVSPTDIGAKALSNIVFCLLISWTLTHYYERSNNNSKNRLRQMANHDALTQLKNRHAFYDYFQQNNRKNLAIISLDLDFFKRINDTYGHDGGDYTLVEVAKVLMSFQSDNIHAFRLGGEEFTMLTLDKKSEQVYQLAEEILSAISEHDYSYKGQSLPITASIGIAITSIPPCDLDELSRIADTNLYKAKENGRNCVVHSFTEF